MPLKQHCIFSILPLKCREIPFSFGFLLELLVFSYALEDGEIAFTNQKQLVFLALRMPTVCMYITVMICTLSGGS